MADEYIYTIRPGDTLYRIALRFYGTGEDNILEKLAEINSLQSAALINPGQELKLPYFIPYESAERVGENPASDNGSQLYTISVIKQIGTVTPVEFHHTELEGEPVAARRFIYCWKFQLPKDLTYHELNEGILNKLESQSDKDELSGFYLFDRANSFSQTRYRLDQNKIKSESGRDRLTELLKKADYPVWQNRGLLMTDDWGQPWRIEEYIKNCQRAKQFRFIASNYGEKIEGENASLVFESTEGSNLGRKYTISDVFSQQTYFAFYTPKEIEELHFVDNYCSTLPPEDADQTDFTIDAVLDAREYFKPGERYIFAFAPPDVLWARDEYVNVEMIPHIRAPEVGEMDINKPDDFIRKVYESTNYRYLVDHKPTYYTDGDWDPEKMVEDGRAGEVTIPQPEKGTYSEKVLKISLEPTIHEYVSLLQKYSYEYDKSLRMYIRATRNIPGLEKSLDEIKNFSSLMLNYTADAFRIRERQPPERIDSIDNASAKGLKSYIDGLTNYMDKVKSEKLDLSKFAPSTTLSNFNSYDVHEEWPQRCKDTAGLIKDQKPTEFVGLEDRLAKIDSLLLMPEFIGKLDSYIEGLESLTGSREVDYFSFRHPLFGATEPVMQALTQGSLYPDQDRANKFYEDHIIPIETIILSGYKDADLEDFHKEVTTEILRNLLDYSFTNFDPAENEPQHYKMFEDDALWSGEGNSGRELFEELINGDIDFMEGRTLPAGKHLALTLMKTANSCYTFADKLNGAGIKLPIMDLVNAYSSFRVGRIAASSAKISKALQAGDYAMSMVMLGKFYGGPARRMLAGIELAQGSKIMGKSHLVDFYSDFIKSNFYKANIGRTPDFRSNPRNMARQIVRDADVMGDNLAEGITGRANRVGAIVSGAFNGISITLALVGMAEVLNKEGELEAKDCVKLLGYMASGGLAILELPYDKLKQIFMKYPKISNAMGKMGSSKLVVKGVPILTIVEFITNAVEAGMDAAWDARLGDTTMMVLNTVRSVVYGVGAAALATKMLVTSIAKKIGEKIATRVLGLINPICTYIFIIITLLEVTKWLIEMSRTGTEKTYRMLLDDCFRNYVLKIEGGSVLIDETELYNLAPMWSLDSSDRVEVYSCVSPTFIKVAGTSGARAMGFDMGYSKRVLSRYSKFNASNFTAGSNAVSSLSWGVKFYLLDYRYTVPSLTFRGWPKEMIVQLHDRNWSSFLYREGDKVLSIDTIKERIDIYYHYWTSRLEMAYERENEEAKFEISQVKQALTEGRRLDDSYFDGCLGRVRNAGFERLELLSTELNSLVNGYDYEIHAKAKLFPLLFATDANREKIEWQIDSGSGAVDVADNGTEVKIKVTVPNSSRQPNYRIRAFINIGGTPHYSEWQDVE